MFQFALLAYGVYVPFALPRIEWRKKDAKYFRVKDMSSSKANYELRNRGEDIEHREEKAVGLSRYTWQQDIPLRCNLRGV